MDGAPEISGELSKLESLFFHVTKVLIYKTLSSPLRVTHLLLQSKNVIIEHNEECNSLTKSTINTIKQSWLFWTSSNGLNSESTNNTKTNTFAMIDYLKESNESILPNNSVYSSTNTLNLMHKIIKDNKYGISYLFVGNLYNIIRGLLLHRSAEICYDTEMIENSKDKYIGALYTKGWISWTAATSSLWFASCFVLYPLHNIYINYLFNFDAEYELPQLNLYGIHKLYSGYLLSVWQSVCHCFLYYKLTDIVCREGRDDLFGNIVSKYIAMGCCNIICYPFHTIQKRMMITNENIQQSFYNIIEKQSFWSLFDGLYAYLLKALVSQICIDGCNMFIVWYKNVYKRNIVNNNININDTDVICNICLENKKQFVFNCGHCVCQQCKVRMIRTRKQCHICRANIVSVQKVYI